MNRADTSRSPGKKDRKARLAEELRANLQRRKAQARSRRTGAADERPEGLAAAPGEVTPYSGEKDTETGNER